VGRVWDVLRLARVLVGILRLALRGRYLGWARGPATEAAHAIVEVAAAEWARNVLAKLNIAAGNGGAATELLGSAGELFEAAGDPEAAELTSQNLQQIAAIAPPPGLLDRIVVWSASHKAVILIVGVIALAGGVAGAFALIDGDGDGDGEPSQQSGETPGGEQPGGEQPGGEQPGGEQPGGEQPGGEPLDVPRPGGASVGPTHATPGAPASGVD
jgi:hypothetical protein